LLNFGKGIGRITQAVLSLGPWNTHGRHYEIVSAELEEVESLSPTAARMWIAVELMVSETAPSTPNSDTSE
jgi:hypothetical protein